MVIFIKNYCPTCRHETTHKIWKEDCMEDTGVTIFPWGVFTAGFSTWDSVTYCKCCSCGRAKRI